jgi:hypothetical protein
VYLKASLVCLNNSNEQFYTGRNKIRFRIQNKRYELDQTYQMNKLHTGPDAHPAFNEWASEALPAGIMRLRREADHSPASSVDLKNAWSYTSTFLHVFME